MVEWFVESPPVSVCLLKENKEPGWTGHSGALHVCEVLVHSPTLHFKRPTWGRGTQTGAHSAAHPLAGERLQERGSRLQPPFVFSIPFLYPPPF